MTRTVTIYTKIEDEEYKFISMTKDDIRVGNVIFYLEEDNGLMSPHVIDTVLNKEDKWKAFSANGCRYGIEDFYVMRYY